MSFESTVPRLRIAHVFQSNGTDFAEPTAPVVHVYHTLRSLAQRGHQVVLIAPRGLRLLCTQSLKIFEQEPGNAEFLDPGLSGTRTFQFFERGIRRIQKTVRFPYLALFDSFRVFEGCREGGPFDLIHERYNLMGLGGVLAAARLRIPYVLEVHADPLAQRKFRGEPDAAVRRLLAKATFRLNLRLASRIVPVSEALKEHLIRTWKVNPDKVDFIPCAADPESFAIKTASSAFRKESGVDSACVLVWVGGFYPWHDLELILQSFAVVQQESPGVKLVLVGDGDDRAKIQARIRELDLTDDVILTGRVPHARIPEILSAADVALAADLALDPSAGGTGTPLKIFEYMMAGKAIVATDSRQVRDVIQDRETGVLVPPGDATAFARATLTLVKNETERKRLAENARNKAIRELSWDRFASRLEQTYEKCLGTGQSGQKGFTTRRAKAASIP
ncbi:MAG TPA: glycosyltransferase family 4 protein, partial [Acidobacteriota bacterium]|nr:glycosyltransferase family 4 protein [Acidobacteriota bacterium]